MVSERQALSAWQDSLEEEIRVESAELVVDRVGDVATQEALDRQSADFDRKLNELAADFDGKLADQSEALSNRLAAAWRRDLLLIAVPQFMALIAILAGVGA